MNTRRKIRKRATDDNGAVVLPIGRAWGGIKIVRAAGAVGDAVVPWVPIEQHAAEKPAVGEALAKLRPVIAIIILANFDRVFLTGDNARRIEGINAIRAVAGDVVHECFGQPIELVLEGGVKMIRPRVGRAHRVVAVAIFDMRAGADHTVAISGPRVGVPQPVIMAELVARDTGTG